MGRRADLTILDRDLFAVEPAAILDIRATATIIDGEVVYRADPR